jgi:methionyl-tRNA formyltransferase
MSGQIPRIVFFGTPEISVSFLNALVKHHLHPTLVVTQPDRPVGRKQVLTPPPVKVAAEQHGLPVKQFSTFKDSAVKDYFETIEADVFIVVAFGLIFPKWLLDRPRLGCLNLHASLLPKYRGASPIQWAILDGATTTGWTLMKMDPGLDTGPILAQTKLTINADETTPSLTSKLAMIGGEFLAHELPDYLSGLTKTQAQDDTQATHTMLLQKESGRIDWSTSAKQLDRQIRAYLPWPGSYAFWGDQKIEILAATATSEAVERPIGTVIETNGLIGIVTGNGVLWPMIIKPASKNAQSVSDFVRGHSEFLGSRLS